MFNSKKNQSEPTETSTETNETKTKRKKIVLPVTKVPAHLRGITTQLVFITPALAHDWLDSKNNVNRKIKDQSVSRMACDMIAKRYFLTHQGIAFDTDNELADGQHRLEAIVESDVGQWMLVTIGLDPQARQAIDIGGVSRTAVDVLKLAHGTDAPAMRFSVSRVAASGMNTFNRYRSPQENIAFYLEHQVAVDWAFDVYPTKRTGLKRAQVRGVLTRAYYTADHAKVARFCEVLQDIELYNSADPTEAVIVKLRNFLIDEKGSNYSASMAIYKKTSFALNAYLSGGVPPKTLREVKHEPFLLPHEPFLLPGEDTTK